MDFCIVLIVPTCAKAQFDENHVLVCHNASHVRTFVMDITIEMFSRGLPSLSLHLVEM
jgi:hypothetical protein